MFNKSKLTIIFISSFLVLLFFLVSLRSNVLANGMWGGKWSSEDPGGPSGTLIYEGYTDRPDDPNEANIYIYGDTGYYAVDSQQCDPPSSIINNTIAVEVNKDNENGSPWLCDGSGKAYYSFKAHDFAGSVFNIYPPIGTTCDQLTTVVPGYGCVIFRRASGSTCIEEGGCGFSPYSCAQVLSRVSPDWSTNRCIINAPFFVADATIYAKTSAIPTPTPIPPTPTPTPPLCPTGIINSPSDNICLGPPPTLSASYNYPANTIEFVSYGWPIGWESPWICSSGWQSGMSSSDNCLPWSGSYVWGIRTKNTDSSVCRVPSPHNVAPTRRIRIDADAPTHTQATATYNESTKQITFSWSSSDVGCGGCSSKACAYWLQGKWTDEISGVDVGWWIDNGSWTPSSYVSPSYTGFSCTGHEGLTAKLLIRQARDSKSNSSPDLGRNFSIAGTFTCPAPPPSLGNLYIDADGTAESVKGETYGFSGSREDDDDNPYYIKGSNTYNYMVTSQEVDSNISGSAENIGLSGVIFATTSEPADLLDAMTKVDDNDGFIALFANKNVTVAGKSFSKYKYYYYAKNSSGSYVWTEKFICDRSEASGIIRLEAKQNIAAGCVFKALDAALSPYFQVTLYKGLTASENREYGTYAYVYDYYNENEIMVSKDPTVFP